MKLKDLKKEAEKANKDMGTNFTVEYQRKGFNHGGEWVCNCYILKESGDFEEFGTPSEIIWKMKDMAEKMMYCQ